ncbi:MAG: YkoP family protein [Rhizomicrobium sp.]
MGNRYSSVALGRRFWTKAERQPGVGELPQPRKYVPAGDHWIARAVGIADVLLRRCHGVHEFTSKRTCLFRVALRRATRETALSCGLTVRPGGAVVELHLWNEHFLRIPRHGPDLAWANIMRRRFRDSLGDLAIHMDEDPALNEAVAVCGCGGIAYDGNGGKVIRFMEKFGFEVFPCPDRNAAETVVEFFCDLWVFFLVFAFNPRSARADLLFRRRYELWMSREVLRQRFGRLGDRGD